MLSFMICSNFEVHWSMPSYALVRCSDATVFEQRFSGELSDVFTSES